MNKTNIKTVILAVFIMMATMGLKAQNTMFDKYADMKGITYVVIDKSMFGMSNINLPELTGDISNLDLSDMSKIIIVWSDSNAAKETINKDIAKLIKNNDYNILMQTRDDEESMYILKSKSASPSEMIHCSISRDESGIVVIYGSTKDK